MELLSPQLTRFRPTIGSVATNHVVVVVVGDYSLYQFSDQHTHFAVPPFSRPDNVHMCDGA